MISIIDLRDYAALAHMMYVDLTGVDTDNYSSVVDASVSQKRTPSLLGNAFGMIILILAIRNSYFIS